MQPIATRHFIAGLAAMMFVGGVTSETAFAQVRGHYDWHPGHYDYHNGHTHWHRGHYDYHPNVGPRYAAPAVRWGVTPQLNLYVPVTPTVPAPVYGPSSGYAAPQYYSAPNQGTYNLPQNSLAAPQYGTSVPAVNYDGGPIVISSPADAPAPLSYVLNGYPYTMKPGESQQFANDRNWVVQFTRGVPGSADKKYTLSTGKYRFEASSQGWDLVSDAGRPVSITPAPPTPGDTIPLPGR